MKKIIKFISLLMLVTVTSAGAASDTHITDLLLEKTYQGNKAGDIIWDYCNYNSTVSVDPYNQNNLVLKQVFGGTETIGFLPNYPLSHKETSSGLVVVEEDVMFSINSGRSFEHGVFMRSADRNSGFQLWTGTNGYLYGVYPENDKWYKVTCAIDVDTAEYKIYIQDNNGLLLREVNNFSLPAGYDYSYGLSEIYTRFTGTSDTGDCIYTDNLLCYKSTPELLDAKIRMEDSAAKENMTFYSDELCNKLSESTVLYINNPYGYVGNRFRKIDSENISVTPVIINDRTYIPVRFVSESLGSEVSWDGTKNRVTITLGNRIVQMSIGSKKITVDGNDKTIDSPVMVKNDRTLVPIRVIAEAFDKTVTWYDEGIVVIGANERLSDEMVSELFLARYFTQMPDSVTAEEHLLSASEQETRKSAFDRRNSDEEIKKLATEFFGMIDLSLPELRTVSMYYNSGQYVMALKEYRKFAFEALKIMDEDYWDWNFAYQYDSSHANNKGVYDNSDKMLFDVIVDPNGKALRLGNPGMINFGYNLPTTPYHPGGYSGQSNFMWNYSLYDPLFYSFNGTGNISYLTKWCEYIDDWCINENSFSKLLPPQIPDSHNGNSMASTFIYQLKLLADKLPYGGEGFSELTMARAMLKIVKEYPVVTVTYMRSNPQNWTPGFAAAMISTGLQLEKLGFKYSDYYVRAGLRRAEDFATTQIACDGTQTETTMGYLTEYIKYNPVVTNLIRKYKPELVTDSWYNIQNDNLEKTVDLVVGLLTPQATYPAGFRDTLRSRANQIEELLLQVAPEMLQKEETVKILNAVRGMDDGKDIGFTSVWYPNAGYYSIKDGWTNGSQSGFMYSAPYPYQRPTGDNMFVLNAFGRDMLVAGEVGAYDAIRSPMLADGQQQNATIDRTFWGHRNSMVSATDEYGNYRWNSSGSIDFMEGAYSGVYGNGNVSDTVHERQVSFLKECGLWIVTDRLTSEQSHTYTQKWRIPVTPTGNSGRDYVAFDASDIVIDSENNILRTQHSDNANLSIYYFGNKELTHNAETEYVSDSNAYKISDFYCVNTNFSGSGANMLLSVIYPRKDIQTDVVSISERNDIPEACGFSAELIDGTKVDYLVAEDKSANLKINNIEAICESLLVKEKDGAVKGIVLSCDSIFVDGREYSFDAADFEFEISADGTECINELNTPLETVRVYPERNVFCESVDVEMSGTGGDIEIRYTLDGSEPDKNSLLYTGAVNLTETTTVKARAYRKNKDSIDCTAVSPVTTAVYTKKSLKPASEPGGTEPGVECEYYKGDWKKAFVSLDWCEPEKQTAVSKVFDTSLKDTGGDFAFRYSGYMYMPDDGVYTFYAPEEYIMGDIMEGYELNLYIDDELWYPETSRHSFGTWSTALEKGYHKICVEYADCRGTLPAFFNTMGPEKIMWDGSAPEIMFDGPELEKQPISAQTLFSSKYR